MSWRISLTTMVVVAVSTAAMGAQEVPPAKTSKKDLESAAKEVQSAQKIMEQRLAELRQATEAVKKPLSVFHPDDAANNKMTLESFQKLVKKHLEIVDLLEKTRPEFEQNWARFQGALESTPAAYRSLAEAYEKRAQEAAKAKGEAADFFSKQYGDWAKRSRECAATFEAQAKEWQLIHDKVDEKLAFVAHSREFLHDLAKFLPIWEKANQNRDDVVGYLQLLDGYVTNFKSTLKIFEEFSNKLKTPASSYPPLPAKVSQIYKASPANVGKETLLTAASAEPVAPHLYAEQHYQAGKDAEARGDFAAAKTHYLQGIAACKLAIANRATTH
jgi:hypothetical protein